MEQFYWSPKKVKKYLSEKGKTAHWDTWVMNILKVKAAFVLFSVGFLLSTSGSSESADLCLSLLLLNPVI